MESDNISLEITSPTDKLLSIVSCNMLKESSFYQPNDSKLQNLILTLNQVYETDPEFILQVAYYSRNYLNLRSITNFILSYASIRRKTRILLQNYFRKSVKLPTDVIEIVDFSQILAGINFTTGENQKNELKKYDWQLLMSRELSENIKLKFSDFDEYTLGKYCSEGKRKRQLLKRKRIKQQLENKNDKKVLVGLKPPKKSKKPFKKLKYINKHKIDENELQNKLSKITTTNMKKLVKYCKISKPQILVRKILGLKYPENEEEYLKLLNEEGFNASKKLAESSKKFDENLIGKKLRLEIPKTWETELSKKGNTKETWQNLIQENKLGLLASLRNLRNMIEKNIDEISQTILLHNLSDYNAIIKSKIFPHQFYSAYKIVQNLQQGEETRKLYLDVIEKALKISVAENLNKIPGKCLVFTDTSGSMEQKISNHSDLTMKEIGVLLGIMINSACDGCEFRAFSSPGECKDGHILIQLNKNQILQNIDFALQTAHRLGCGTEIPQSRLDELILNKEIFDYIIIISDMMMGGNRKELKNFLIKYRKDVNPNMKYVAINLNSYGFKIEDDENKLNMFISGFSDKILSMLNSEKEFVSQQKEVKEICIKEICMKEIN